MRVIILHDSYTGWDDACDPHGATQRRRTVASVSQALGDLGHDVITLAFSPDLYQDLTRAGRPDLVFNLATGAGSRAYQAHIAALLELAGVAFTGSGMFAHSLALQKATAKAVFRAAGLPTADWAVVPPGAPLSGELPLPALVKPVAEGSSLGIHAGSVVADRAGAQVAVARIHAEFREPALIESFLTGREFTVAVLGNSPPRALPAEELVFATGHSTGFYTVGVKARDEARPVCPADCDPSLSRELARLAEGAFTALGCRDYARVDIRLDAGGRPNLLEVNTLPGLEVGYSDLPRIAEAAGVCYRDLINAIAQLALGRRAPA